MDKNNWVNVNVELDEEWVELISIARKMGIPPEEVRQFFLEQKYIASFTIDCQKGVC
ncbi:anti-repressor SinI family protein [Paenibacillus eucommiae]|uniref:Sin domain-containing protein n=1 Tax=Paenibacillus eucommiae TaxID=1355755 RepID=A0ABS4IRR8_9BACL|nr:anti-repressor SinI family protein [Paenibacillus eucommiae]MBP1989830.1 hypothetical protein [Paenibacillus eucommiae]